MAVEVTDALQLAESMQEDYKAWLKENGIVTSFKNSLRFVRHTHPNWRKRWGIIKTDVIAEELHDSFLR